MMQVLINLIVNAREAMDEQGEIVVEADYVDLDGVKCTVCGEEVHGRYVVIEVMDSGEGIEERALQRLFHQYTPSQIAAEEQEAGLGLVNRIVHEFGGHIHVDSTRGKGTTLKVILRPFELVTNDAWRRPQPSAKYNIDKHVLVIDDEHSTAFYISELLKSENIKCTVEIGYAGAVKYATEAQDNIDLIILGANVVSGQSISLFETLAVQLQGRVPIIGLFSCNEEVNEQRLMSLGVRHILYKPVSASVLKAKVCNVLKMSVGLFDGEMDALKSLHQKDCADVDSIKSV